MRQILILAVGVALIGAGIWYKMQNTSASIASWLKDKGATSSDVSGFENAFLKAWKSAVKSGEPGFSYNGSTYNSKGGKKIG